MTEEKKKKRLMIWIMSALLTAAVIVSAVNLMKYNERKKEFVALALEREELRFRVDELKYRLSAPIDDKYIEKVAREKLGLFYPDEIIYFDDIPG